MVDGFILRGNASREETRCVSINEKREITETEYGFYNTGFVALVQDWTRDVREETIAWNRIMTVLGARTE